MENFGDQDLAGTFFCSLDTSLKRLMEADGFKLPPRTPNKLEHELYQRIDNVYAHALRSKKRAAANNTLAQVVSTPNLSLHHQV